MRGLRSKVAADEGAAIDERVATPNHATATLSGLLFPHRIRSGRSTIITIVWAALLKLSYQGPDLLLSFLGLVAIEYLCELLYALTLRKIALDES
jgi:hypothetical protein